MFKLKVQIAEHEWLSGEPQQDDEASYNNWIWRLKPTERRFQSYFHTLEAMEKVFVYLMDGDKAICYWKGNVPDLADLNPEYKYYALKADRALGKVKEDCNAGLIGMKISINNESINGPITFKDYPAWSQKMPKRLDAKKVRCYIFQCRDLPAADDDGSTDCFISIWNSDGKKLETKVVEDTLNPIIFETI